MQASTIAGMEVQGGGAFVMNGTVGTIDCTYVEVTGQISNDPYDDAYAATITPNWNNGNSVRVGALTNNVTIANSTNPRDGATYVIETLQDGTGSRTVSWDAKYKFGNATAPNDTALNGTSANSVCHYTFRYNAASDIYICQVVSYVEL